MTIQFSIRCRLCICVYMFISWMYISLLPARLNSGHTQPHSSHGLLEDKTYIPAAWLISKPAAVWGSIIHPYVINTLSAVCRYEAATVCLSVVSLRTRVHVNTAPPQTSVQICTLCSRKESPPPILWSFVRHMIMLHVCRFTDVYRLMVLKIHQSNSRGETNEAVLILIQLK